ncbi:hypothetical protein AYO20_10346 [Fonsecaea nubica]|uniref:Ketoreductase domain-containing protein n=1 Tax=Fonsecaea nubica TaxID=856822 RepID=A0A178CAR2_9EURO|nr:hypothetical protein AYO20_10346 [Fonsecaea nubica]OAL25791.1 hypothetical protein AYO20_10346 [Fonsecaea nubica]
MALLAKTIAITGAASGIGRMTTICLAGQGANLSIADLDLDKLQEVAAEVKRQHPDCAVMCTALDRFGLLDGAVNLAGVLRQGLVSDFALDDWRLVLDVNLTGVVICTKAQVRSMNDGGSIVNASSRAGLHGTANYAAYCASKHGVIGLTKAVAQEVGAKGIRANYPLPEGKNEHLLTVGSVPARGVIDTPMTAAFEGVPPDQIIQRKGRPDEIASLIAYLLGDQSRFITASAITIDGGLP